MEIYRSVPSHTSGQLADERRTEGGRSSSYYSRPGEIEASYDVVMSGQPPKKGLTFCPGVNREEDVSTLCVWV